MGTFTIDKQNAINERAKTKKNGCYQWQGIAYRVVDGQVTHFAAYGQLLQQYRHFNVVLGTLEHWSSNFGLKYLKTLK